MRPFQFLCLTLFFLLFCCKSSELANKITKTNQFVIVLGIAQDGGYPHIDNSTEFSALKQKRLDKQLVTSLGLVDRGLKKKWLFEATPDMPTQLHELENLSFKSDKIIDGIFLTHAHIGHYTGLMYLGREAMGAKSIAVYAMPRMQTFLKTNQPWKQLVELENILLNPLVNEQSRHLSQELEVTPILVPHRDELSETVGYKIKGSTRTLLFIPDINKWNVWEKNIVDEVKQVDYALLDATFYEDGEIPRPMSEVPHPFITETIKVFKNTSKRTKSKIYFIHFNHSNPVLKTKSKTRDSIERMGFNFAKFKQVFTLDN